MMPRFLGSLLLLSTLITAPAIASNAISGQLRLLDLDEQPVTESSEYAHAVAYFEPADTSLGPVEGTREVLTTRRRQFQPRVLPIQLGTEVVFPNEDRILHNVFSSSQPNPFDLGLYAESEGKSHRFTQPGLVRVFCNVHPAMYAHIVVVNGPHFVIPAPSGHFRLEELPPGPGVLTLWHERSEPLRIELTVTDGSIELGSIELAMTIRQLQRQRERRRQPLRRGNF
jgi:plastocyanin